MASSKEEQALPRRVAVVGAGAWGTALARHLAFKGLEVDFWVREPEVLEEIITVRENRTFLPGVFLPEGIRPSHDFQTVVAEQKVVMLVVPSPFVRGVLKGLSGFLSPGVILCSGAKGIENDTLLTMSQVMTDVLPPELAFHKTCLSGPSFAREVGQGLPTAVTVAAGNVRVSRLLQTLFASPLLRVYSSQDLIGVELGGSLKNIYAVSAGICDGLGLGTNARAALITRGLAEMSRLGVRMGANPLTFMGLAGVGDLILTCTGDLSRNRTVGLKLGRGQKLADILAEMKQVAEGIKTTKSVYDLARREGVDMPVCEQVYYVLHEGKDPKRSLVDFMTRDLKAEIDQVLMV
ncbi:MAG: NAD(P)H-dependent glycerol-3-phosphate dehydrogenase [Pseudomonadota bacterium]